MNRGHMIRQNYQTRAAQSRSQYQRKQGFEIDYDETVSVMAEMLSTIKNLLEKTMNIKVLFENQSQASQANQSDISIFKEYLFEIEERFLSRKINHKMAGPFTFRLSKQLNYWRFAFPFCLQIIQSIETKFQEQKTSEQYNLLAIFFQAIKKIDYETMKIFKTFIKKEKKQSQNKEQETKCEEKPIQKSTLIQEQILIVNVKQQSQKDIEQKQEKKKIEKKVLQVVQEYELKQMAQQKALSKKKQMWFQMMNYINTIYKGLEIKSISPIDQYFCDLSPQDNADIFCKEQKKRNKKIKKYLKELKSVYDQFIERTKFRFVTRLSRSVGKNKSILRFSKVDLTQQEKSQKRLSFFKNEQLRLKNKENQNKKTHFSREKNHSKSKSKLKHRKSMSLDQKTHKSIKSASQVNTKKDVFRLQKRLLIEPSTKKVLKIIR